MKEYIVEGKPQGSNKWCWRFVSEILFSFDDAIDKMNKEKRTDELLYEYNNKKWEYRVLSREVSKWEVAE